MGEAGNGGVVSGPFRCSWVSGFSMESGSDSSSVSMIRGWSFDVRHHLSNSRTGPVEWCDLDPFELGKASSLFLRNHSSNCCYSDHMFKVLPFGSPAMPPLSYVNLGG